MKLSSAMHSTQRDMNRLQSFTADLLGQAGALVEAIDPEGLDVVAPPQLQGAMGVPELCRLGFGATLPAGARRVDIEADWLACLAKVMGERGHWVRHVVDLSNPPLREPERLLEHELALDNAIYRLQGVEPAWTRYLILHFRYKALADEKRQGLLRLGINLATGAVLDGIVDRLSPWLDDEAALPPTSEPSDLPDLWDRQQLVARIHAALCWSVNHHIEPFIKSLKRRLARDEARLYDYHNQLFQDSMRRLVRLAEGDDKRRREELRLEATRREYRARLHDLGNKYALQVTAEWVQTRELVMPVQRVLLLVRRRKGERLIQVDWNPLARRLEPLPCDFGHAADTNTRLSVCDDALHILAPGGLGACGHCGKPYCRACHSEHCPKCGQPDVQGASGLAARGQETTARTTAGHTTV